jgi:MFS family permease
MVATLPGRTHGLGLITEPLLRDLELGRVDYARINLWATLLGAVFCVPCGWWIDRFGARRVLTLVLLGLGFVVLALSRVETTPTLFALVALTRGLGQSMLSVVSITLVGKWFTRRLPLAMGVYSICVGIGFSKAFTKVGARVLEFGWRDAWAEIGWALLAFAAVAWLLVRDGPERKGEIRDADLSPTPSGKEWGATFGQALATPAFWVFAVAVSTYGMVSSGISLFNQSILAERGFAPEVFHTVLSIGALTGMASNLLGGWIAARWSLGGVLGAAMFAFGGALLALPYVSTLAQVYAYAVTLGAAGGAITVVFFSVWGHAFGKLHLGKIQGLAQMLTVFASAGGPLLFAACHARTGSYMLVFWLLAPLAAALGLLAWAIRLPRAADGVWEPTSAFIPTAHPIKPL